MEFSNLYNNIKSYSIDSEHFVVHSNDTPKNKLIKILKKRIYDATRAYLVLLDNKLTSDAILIAGHILETATMIVYINDSDKNYHIPKYTAHSCIQYIYSLFKNIPFAEKQDLQQSIACTLSALEQDGYLIINEKLAKKQSDKKSLNDSTLNMLKNPTLSYETKVKIIEIFYNLPKISDYVEYFCKQMGKKYKTQNLPKLQQPISTITAFYDKYCEIKHASIYCCSYEENDSNDIIPINFDSDQSIPIVAFCLDMIKTIA